MQIKAELPPQHFVSRSPGRGSSSLLSFSFWLGSAGAPWNWTGPRARGSVLGEECSPKPPPHGEGRAAEPLPPGTGRVKTL